MCGNKIRIISKKRVLTKINKLGLIRASLVSCETLCHQFFNYLIGFVLSCSWGAMAQNASVDFFSREFILKKLTYTLQKLYVKAKLKLQIQASSKEQLKHQINQHRQT